MKMIKISVIIPVYNGEKHIHSCIESLQDQTLEDIEFIFINDGSIDNSLNILKSYESDSRIKVFSQENKGVSAARNLGIQQAKGDFIGFLDCDDIHKPNMYETLYTIAKHEDLDIVVSNILLQRDGKFISKKSKFLGEQKYNSQVIQEKIIPYVLGIEDITLMIVSNKIYKKEFLLNNRIFFDESLKLDEDTLFNLKALFYSKSVKFVDYNGYIYKDNAESVTRDFLKNNIFEQNLEKYKFDYLSYLPLDLSEEELKKLKSSRFIYNIVFLIFKSAINKKINSKQRNQFIARIVENQEVQKASHLMHNNYLIQMRKFEKLIVYCIQNRKTSLALLITTMLHCIYSPKISEFIRKFNK